MSGELLVRLLKQDTVLADVPMHTIPYETAQDERNFVRVGYVNDGGYYDVATHAVVLGRNLQTY